MLGLVLFLTFHQNAWSIDLTGEGELHRVSLSKNEGAGSLISGQAETGQQLLGNSIETNEQYGIGKPLQSLDISGTVKPTEKLPTNTSVNIASSSSQVTGQSSNLSNSSNSSLLPTNLNQGENLPLRSGNASLEKEPSLVQPNNAVTMTPKPSQITTLSETFVEMNNRNLSDTGNMNSVSNFQTPIAVGADESLSDISTSRPLPRPQGTVSPGQGYTELPTFQKQSTAMPDHADNSNFQDKLPESNVIPGIEDETEDKYEDLKPLYRYTSSPASVQSDSEDLVDQEEGEEGEEEYKNENGENNDDWYGQENVGETNLGNEDEVEEEANHDFWNDDEEKKDQYLHVASVNSVLGGEDEPVDEDGDEMAGEDGFNDENDDNYNEDNEDKESFNDEYYNHGGGLAEDKVDDRKDDDVKDIMAEEWGAQWREKATLAPPYIKEDLITQRTFNLDERIDEEIGLMTFYSWILFIVFVMISMCVFFRHRHAVRAYWSRSRGTKYHSNLSQVEEGKSLMKNMYA